MVNRKTHEYVGPGMRIEIAIIQSNQSGRSHSSAVETRWLPILRLKQLVVFAVNDLVIIMES